MAATAFFTMATASSLVTGSAANAPELSTAMAAIATPALMRNARLIVLISFTPGSTRRELKHSKANKIPAFDPGGFRFITEHCGRLRRIGRTLGP